MATQPVTYKKVFGDYEISTTDVDGSTQSQIVLRSEQVRIYGDLVVTGDQSVVSETNLAISDNEILLNEGEGGAGVTLGTSGITVDRGSLTNVGIRWNESAGAWECTNDGTTWKYLMQSSSSASGLTQVFDDLTPELGGNLDVLVYHIVSSSNRDVIVAPDGTGKLRLDSELKVVEVGSAPGATAGYNTVYAQTPGAGGTGLYVQNSTVNDELVSKSKAIVFSIIF